jgi:hypothetical protein
MRFQGSGLLEVIASVESIRTTTGGEGPDVGASRGSGEASRSVNSTVDDSFRIRVSRFPIYAQDARHLGSAITIYSNNMAQPDSHFFQTGILAWAVLYVRTP